MEHINPSGEVYRYDAFISYRHLPLDMAVAARLQELLENYRPPKNVEGLRQQRITRVFRDTSELPTSGDLGNDISEALRSSRFLIVICSEHIRESRWCMEEINLFKKYHNGRTDHILPLLVSGEPGEVFPEQLLVEKRTRVEADGSEHEYDVAIEPLCADVRADTVQKSLKRLKTEFLRIAAPILGCSFDTLFQRHLRRRRRRIIIALSTSLGLLSAVLLTVSIFAYRTWVSERAYRETLAENYMMQASDRAFADQPQQALMYFAQALSAAPEELPAAYAGAALLLQDYAWPVMEEELSGTILDGAYDARSWAVAQLEGGYYLRSTLSATEVCDEHGTTIREIPHGEDEYVTFLTGSAGQWGFRVESRTDLYEQRLLLYDPAADNLRTVEKPTDVSRYYSADAAVIDEYSIAAVGADRAIVTGAGLVRMVAFDAAGTPQTLYTADLADAFPVMEKAQSIGTVNDLWLSDDCTLVAVRHLTSIAVYETDGLKLCGTIDTANYAISDVLFSGHGTLALACGNSYSFSGSHANPGGLFGVYRTNGNVIYQSQPDQENAFLGVAFAPENEDLLLTWSQNMAAVFDLSQERFLTAPVYCPNVTSACFYDDGSICVASSVYTLQGDTAGEKHLTLYRYVELPGPEASLEEGEGAINTPYASEKRTAAGPDGKTLVCDGWSLSMYGADGNVLASRDLPAPALASLITLSEDGSTVYVGDTTFYSGLLIAPVDFSAHTIGAFHSADTAGGTVLNLWALGDLAAVETSAREIMVFRPDGQRIFSTVPRHSSLPVGIVTDPLQRYVAIYLEETATQQGVIGYEQNSYIEVWDIDSGLLIADYAVPGKELQTLAITREGVLLWGTGSRTYSRLIPAAAPDEEALKFLAALCSLTPNERQEDVSQTPVKRELSPDNWYEALGGWQNTTFQREAGQDESLAAAINWLSRAEDAGTAPWIAQCDEVWQSLAEGDIAYTISELDIFFENYAILAANRQQIDGITFGLQTYFALVEQAMENSTEVVSSSLVSSMLPILCETKTFDDLIGTEFLRMAERNEADIAAADTAMQEETDESEIYFWEEVDRPLLQLTACQLRAWAACLTGGEAQAAWLDMAAFCLDYDVLFYSLGDAYASLCLLQGNATDAAGVMNEVLSLQTLGLSEEDLQFFADYFAEHLESVGIMLYRDLIDPAVANAYLENLNASFGVEVTAVGTVAQGSGIQLGDTITAVNGQMITSLAHAKRLLAEENAVCTIRRGDEWITVPVSSGVTYQFFCTLA